MAKIDSLDFAEYVEEQRLSLISKNNYAGNIIDKDSSLEKAIDLTNVAESEEPVFYWDENYPNIEKILDANTEDCDYKFIMLLPDDVKTISVSNLSIPSNSKIIMSDGQEHIAKDVKYITFDYKKDIPYPGKRFKTRWIMVIAKDASSATMYLTSAYENCIALVYDAKHYNFVNCDFTMLFNNGYSNFGIEYIKFKNVDFVFKSQQRWENKSIGQLIFENCSFNNYFAYISSSTGLQFIGKTNNKNIMTPNSEEYIRYKDKLSIDYNYFTSSNNYVYLYCYAYVNKAAVKNTYPNTFDFRFFANELVLTDYTTNFDGRKFRRLYEKFTSLKSNTLTTNPGNYMVVFTTEIDKSFKISGQSTGKEFASLSITSLLYMFKCLKNAVNDTTLTLTLQSAYQDLIENYYVKPVEDTLELCDSSDEGATKILDYINNKNWTLSYIS